MIIALLFVSGVLLGGAYVFNKTLAVEKYHPAVISAIYALCSAIIIAPLAWIGFEIPRQWEFWALAIISPLGFAGSFYAGMKAMQTIDVSVVSLIGRLSLIVSSVVGITLLHDLVPRYLLLGIIVIVVGSGIIVYEKGKLRWSVGTLWAIAMAVGYGVIAMIDKKILEQFSPFAYVFFNNVIVFATFFVLIPKKNEIILALKEFSVRSIAMGFCGVVGWSSFLVLIQKTSVIMAYPIWESTALLTTVLCGVILLNEKENVLKKVLGTILTLIGVFVLSIH